MNGYNFTEGLRQTLTSARLEAARLCHEYVGTEHMLIALMREEGDIPARVVRELGPAPAEVIATVEASVETGQRAKGSDLPYTSRAKKVLELSMNEARLNHHDFVGTEHLLLGLLAEERGIGAQVLTGHGITLAKARQAIGRLVPAFANVPVPPTQRSADFTVRNSSTRLLGVLARSEAIAREHGADAIGPEHVALALAGSREGRVHAALMLHPVDYETLMPALDANAPRLGDSTGPESPALPHATLRSILDSVRSRSTGRGEVTTDQLLLAILDAHAPTAAAFASCGVTAASIRGALASMEG